MHKLFHIFFPELNGVVFIPKQSRDSQRPMVSHYRTVAAHTQLQKLLEYSMCSCFV